MKIYIKNHTFHYEIENLTRVFFPNSKINVIKEEPFDFEKPYILTSLTKLNKDKVRAEVAVEFDNFTKTDFYDISKTEADFEADCERKMAILMFNLLKEYTGLLPPWGILTGVRPIKLFRRLNEEHGIESAKKYFTEKLLVTEEKTKLAALTEKNESDILKLSRDNSYSLYISIPFCPSRCSYCSFVSQSVEKAKKLMEPYVELLCRELECTAAIARSLGLKLETVYIGGGTPTTLSADQIKKLIYTLNNNFPMEECREFTVEAGRPDTITKEKLQAIHSGGANRISINPQTLNDEILEAIGRRHTARQTIQAFNLARSVGLDHINMDLIAGLPKETFESFKVTLEKIIELKAESITIHTLSMKKSSYLTAQGMSLYKKDAETAAKMHSFAGEILAENEYNPYYLYRQSRMVGNLENIGYAKKGYSGLYNVFVMDETHTVLGCGAGAVTKLKKPGSAYLERIFNYKYPYEYIDRFDEMIKRKERIIPFYREFS